MQALFRIKANLEGYRSSKPYYSNFHVDCSDEQLYVPTIDGHKHKEVKDMTTGIYYVNTCNGYTEFEDGTIVNSVGNRFVSFPASTKHRGVSQTDTKARVVITLIIGKMALTKISTDGVKDDAITKAKIPADQNRS